jgi:Tol biopolymer transport system component
MVPRAGLSVVFLAVLVALAWGEAAAPSIRARWEAPPACAPFDPPRVKDLKDELRQTGYRLVVALHADTPPTAKGEYPARHLYLINADGSGLKPLPASDREEHAPRTSPDGRWFTYNYGDVLVDAKTLKARPLGGGYVWTPDSRRTVSMEKGGIVYTDVATGKASAPVKAPRRVDILDMSMDGKWFTFELRDYLGSQYNICFMAADGTGEVRKLPNHPIKEGECHPAFSPDGRWICWNGGESLAVRKFAPSLPEGTEGKITTLPKEKLGQDPCGRWSHCGRYIAYVRIPHTGSWKVHAPICIVRVADGEMITLSPPGMVGHHWDYDWLPPVDPKGTGPKS